MKEKRWFLSRGKGGFSLQAEGTNKQTGERGLHRNFGGFDQDPKSDDVAPREKGGFY